jgi:hypothetical protein
MVRAETGNGSPPSTRRHRIFSIGTLVLSVVGGLLLLYGLGKALDFIYFQSHPVPPVRAFMLGFEYTVTGGVLILVALSVRFVPRVLGQ